jgi:GT2 family glycosyltransferase
MPRLMRVSIITPSFDQAAYLEQTLRSVLEQGYPELEYIVIDGGSRDGSAEIIARYAPRLHYWVSEPDRGQVDAINKGLAKATADIVGYLNSDDLYLPGTLQAVAECFRSRPDCRWLCGEGVEIGLTAGEGRPVPREIPRDAAQAAFFNYRMVQPAVFWRRAIFEKYGPFDPKYSYCFDHEFYVRLLAAGERCEPLESVIAAFRLHPTSKTIAEAGSFEPEIRAIREQYLSRLPALAAWRERLRRRWRVAGWLLSAADTDWRNGRRLESFKKGAAALGTCPPRIMPLVARRLRQRFGATRRTTHPT